MLRRRPRSSSAAQYIGPVETESHVGAPAQTATQTIETERALAAIRSHVGLTAGLEETVRAALGVLTNGMAVTA